MEREEPLFTEEEPRHFAGSGMGAGGFFLALILFVLVRSAIVQGIRLVDICYLSLFSVLPLVVFIPALKNFITRPRLEIYKDHIVNTNFGKTNVINLADIKSLRRQRGSFTIVTVSGKKYLTPMLYGIVHARETLQELTDRHLIDEDFDKKRRMIALCVLFGSLFASFIMYMFFGPD